MASYRYVIAKWFIFEGRTEDPLSAAGEVIEELDRAGFCIVPRLPTWRMVKAGMPHPTADHAYVAMIEARPR